jgi:ABC-type transport system involved in cytochrome bd biosynthesis fused ATPase/permease subunit
LNRKERQEKFALFAVQLSGFGSSDLMQGAQLARDLAVEIGDLISKDGEYQNEDHGDKDQQQCVLNQAVRFVRESHASSHLL